MPVVWSKRAIQQQLNLNREVRGSLDSRNFSTGLPDQQLPTLVRAKEDIPQGNQGECAFLEGQLIDGQLSETGVTRQMWNVASEVSAGTRIKAGEQCLAVRIGMSKSGEGGWVLIRTTAGGGDNSAETMCQWCDSGGAPASYTLNVSGATSAPQSVNFPPVISQADLTTIFDEIHKDDHVLVADSGGCSYVKAYSVTGENGDVFSWVSELRLVLTGYVLYYGQFQFNRGSTLLANHRVAKNLAFPYPCKAEYKLDDPLPQSGGGFSIVSNGIDLLNITAKITPPA